MEQNQRSRIDWNEVGDEVGAQASQALDAVRERARGGWSWVRDNPWMVLGAVIGLGVLLSGRRRTSPSKRLAHMDADHAFGHTHATHHRMDEVAKGMSRAGES